MQLRIWVVSDFMYNHLCGRCVPWEVVHSRGGKVMLIVLWNLLELVLVVRESIYTEIPVSTFGKVPLLLCDWLGNVEGWGVLVA